MDADSDTQPAGYIREDFPGGLTLLTKDLEHQLMER